MQFTWIVNFGEGFSSDSNCRLLFQPEETQYIRKIVTLMGVVQLWLRLRLWWDLTKYLSKKRTMTTPALFYFMPCRDPTLPKAFKIYYNGRAEEESITRDSTPLHTIRIGIASHYTFTFKRFLSFFPLSGSDWNFVWNGVEWNHTGERGKSKSKGI